MYQYINLPSNMLWKYCRIKSHFISSTTERWLIVIETERIPVRISVGIMPVGDDTASPTHGICPGSRLYGSYLPPSHSTEPAQTRRRSYATAGHSQWLADP
ncbi:MAG: hypothetical protein H8D56_21805 [Planctomycetes bacterium]|nr:hypothetical protein [Planctomycetota bacterium]MBL7145179.1 hypothetical protein [Phycisphaerae bacterium]